MAGNITVGYGQIWAKQASIPLYQPAGNKLNLVWTVPPGMQAGTGETIISITNPATGKLDDYMQIRDYADRVYFTPTRFIDKSYLLGTGTAAAPKKNPIPIPVKKPGTSRIPIPLPGSGAGGAAAPKANPLPHADGSFNKPGIVPLPLPGWSKPFADAAGKWPWWYWAIGGLVVYKILK